MAQTLVVGTFADLMRGQQYAEIYCMYSGKLVRRLSADNGRVRIDALAPPVVSVDLSTRITFEPWVFDRGNMLFPHPDLPDGTGKLCGEFDVISFRDGSRYAIHHRENKS